MIYNAGDEERGTDAIYLDLRKAFHTALHNFVSKLERHGLDG